jgi:polysaccharide pyruvyl transferase WcaK-like protein
MRRIFIDHGEAYGNIGDEAMLLNALRRLENILGKVRFVVTREGQRPMPSLSGFDIEETPSPYMSFVRICDAPKLPFWVRTLSDWSGKTGLPRKVFEAELLSRSGRLAATDPDFHAFDRALHSCDAFYGVGAADFNDFNSRGAAFKTWLYRLARRAVPVVAVGAQGFGPVENCELLTVMREGFGAVNLLSFRDCGFSARCTESLRVAGCETKIVGDEAFSLPPADSSVRDRVLHEAGLEPSELFVAVHWRATDYTQDTRRFLVSLADACDMVVQATTAKLLFIPMSYDVHSGNDQEIFTELRNHMRSGSQLALLPLQNDARVIKAVIGAALFTIGLSYHVHVFGLSQGRPALILYTGEYYRYKSEGLVGFYGAPSMAIDLERSGSEQIAQAIDRISTGAARARGPIERVNARIREVNDWTMQKMAERIGEVSQ